MKRIEDRGRRRARRTRGHPARLHPMSRWSGLMVLLMTTCAAVALRAGEPPKTPDGALVLFNGRDLHGWDGDSRFWSVQDGAITGQTTTDNPTKANTFLVWRGGVLKDFEL